MITKFRDRENNVMPFDSSRIEQAMFAAVEAVGGTDLAPVLEMTKEVVQRLNEDYCAAADIADIEIVQDTIEKVLFDNGHRKVYNHYREYRRLHAELRALAIRDRQ